MDAKVHKIQAFVTVARLGGLTRAAEELGCTQSTVSRMISGLEADWGVRLFVRRGSGVTLTDEGARLLPDASEVCEAFERLQRHAQDLRGLGTGTVSIAAPASVVAYRLPEAIRRFAAEHPGVELNVLESTYAEAERALRAHEVDIAFLPAKIDGEGFASTLFDRDEIVVVAPFGHLGAPGDVELARLAGERLVADTETAPVLQRQLVSPSIRCTTSDVTAILALVEAGLGISLLPSLTLRGYEARLDIRHLKTPAWRAIYVVARTRGELPVAAAKFMDCLGA